MLVFYIVGVRFYYFLVWLFSFFNKKANFWIEGRKNWRQKFNPNISESKIWFHFASLGEFEQGKPLLQAVRNQFPAKKIIITFFSPSGYEIRKNSPLGDYILYLPLDTAKNAKDFINIFKPEIAVFNKYEYWHYFFKELKSNNIPLYVTSAIFRKQQIFFKPYGGFYRNILKNVTYFFLQNNASADLLKNIGLESYTVCGDTRFDSVADLAKNKRDFPLILDFKADNNLVIAGSTWSDDEKIIAKYLKEAPTNWKFIFAPHEISEGKLQELERVLGQASLRYSKLKEELVLDLIAIKILIIDNIGMLSSIYACADVAYIGGGFGSGIHNTLEAAAWDLPVIFGPKYLNFKEAVDLVSIKGGFTINSFEEFKAIADNLLNNEQERLIAGNKAKAYVLQNIGATEVIMNHVFQNQ